MPVDPSQGTLAGKTIVAFLGTTNAAQSRKFYEDRLGLTCSGDDDFAIVFDTRYGQIRIQKLNSLTPQPFTVLGWSVVSIVKTVGELGNSGVVFEQFTGLEQNTKGIWTSPSGAKIAWFKDPDGNVLSLTEPIAN